jgi:hypothetical protein
LWAAYTVYHNDVIVIFDSQQTRGLAIGGFGAGHVVADHQFSNPGVYPMHAEVEGVCQDNGTRDWGSHQEVNGTIVVFKAPIPVKSLACAPGTVGLRSVCTLTLASRAPSGGTQVKLMSPQTSLLSVPLTAIVPINQLTSTFRVLGKAKGSAIVFVTSGDQSGVVSATVTVN